VVISFVNHKGLGLRFWFFRYSFAHIFLDVRDWRGICCGNCGHNGENGPAREPRNLEVRHATNEENWRRYDDDVCGDVGDLVACANAGRIVAHLRRADLCVTSGEIEKADGDRMTVDVPEMRAVATVATSPSAEIRFRYGGPTEQKSHLGSGQVRSQFGLKLRAQDPCNLVYVVWRVASESTPPESKLVVSVKRNPSQHTSAECHNHGHTNIKPTKSSPIPPLKAGESHTLRAEMRGSALRVYDDNKEVWEGDVGADAAALAGPVGIRSDNVRLEFEYLARTAVGSAPNIATTCKKGDSD
jgi:hypothetical protein